jgi:hypothetical protein
MQLERDMPGHNIDGCSPGEGCCTLAAIDRIDIRRLMAGLARVPCRRAEG